MRAADDKSAARASADRAGGCRAAIAPVDRGGVIGRRAGGVEIREGGRCAADTRPFGGGDGGSDGAQGGVAHVGGAVGSSTAATGVMDGYGDWLGSLFAVVMRTRDNKSAAGGGA